MPNRQAGLLTVALGCGVLVSCLNVIAHDQNLAAKSAEGFAKTAFIDRDDAKAFGLLAARSRPYIPLDKLADTITKIHPKSFPKSVKAIEYEPIPGQRAMMIYLKGDGDGEEFFYRIVLDGDASSGYQVTGLARGNGPYPSTNRKPLTPGP